MNQIPTKRKAGCINLRSKCGRVCAQYICARIIRKEVKIVGKATIKVISRKSLIKGKHRE